MAQVTGNIQGLKTSQLKALNRLFSRRYPAVGGYSTEQARELAALSKSIGRQIGLCINRHGRVFTVIVGTPTGILIPELPRSREASERLRGLRLLHTHLTPALLSEEDCMDMLFLRLDSVGVLTVSEQGEPVLFQYAHLLPKNVEKKKYAIHPAMAWSTVTIDFVEQAEALEDELARASSVQPAGFGGGGLHDGLGSAGDRAYAGGLIHDESTSNLFTKVQEKSLLLNKEAPAKRRAVVVSVSAATKTEQESSLLELAELACSAGVVVAASLLQRVSRVNPRSIIGQGKIAELEVLALQANAGLIIFDCELSPSQLRNLTAITNRVVLDRTQLILDIFAQRAKSKGGKLQVELAQLQYSLPRLVGKNLALDRLAGGIGGRGPGETKLETDRRRVRDRIGRIKKELNGLVRHRESARAFRARSNVPVASFVGYTNAGKSTLLNVLTGSGVLAEDKLFATLDPTTRRLRFPQERELIITDTVGFIRDLPKTLIEAFRATLEELEEADLLLHVVDASHPEYGKQIAAVEGILEQLQLQVVPLLLVLNKVDALDTEARQTLIMQYPHALQVSARSKEGLKTLAQEMARYINWESSEAFFEGNTAFIGSPEIDAEFEAIAEPIKLHSHNKRKVYPAEERDIKALQELLQGTLDEKSGENAPRKKGMTLAELTAEDADSLKIIQ